jgi:hypothetical protein
MGADVLMYKFRVIYNIIRNGTVLEVNGVYF